jgi:anti-anti-sigma factor
MAEDFFHVEQIGPAHLVRLVLPPSMDSEEFDRLNEQMLHVFGSQPKARWVLDLTGLNYMGSSALGLMVNIRQRIKQGGGQLVLCGLSQRLQHIFQTCCMERLFKITRTREDALRLVAD